MAAWDNVSLPRAPGSLAPPLMDFSRIGNLGNDYFRGTQQQRELELQKPITGNDPGQIAQELMRRGGAGYAAQLMPFLQQQQAAQPSPLFGGAPGGAAPMPGAAPGMAPPAAPSPAPAQPGPMAQPAPVAAPARPATTGYSGGDNGQTSLMSLASDFYGDDKGPQVAIRAGAAFKVDPNQPLSPEQVQKVQAAFSSASGRKLEQPAPAGPPAAEPAAPAGPAAAGAQPLLPPGYTDPRKAIVDLRREAARYGGMPGGQVQAKELNDWAGRIEAATSGPQQFGITGHDENGMQTYGFINPYTQSVKAPNGAPTAQSPGAGVSGLAGEDYLATLDPGRAAQIKGIVEGRMAPPTGMALKSPQIQALMRQAAQYEPGFDLVNWQARAATRKDFTAGKSSQNITAFNTAIAHLDTLDKAADALGNRWSPIWNTVANMVVNQTGDPRVKQFEIAKTAVADELTRAFRGSGGNVHDIVQWEKAINSAGSPEQLKGAMKQAVELLRGRIEALGETYNRGMGTTKDPLTLLAPKSVAALQRMTGEDRGTGPAPAASPAAGAKPAGEAGALPRIGSKTEYDRLPSGASFTGPDGKTWQKP